MNTARFYQIVILILVLLNLGTLAFLWFTRPESGRQQRHERPSNLLLRELQLTPPQQDQFGRLRQEHLFRLRQLQKRERNLHERFFSEVLRPEPDTIRMKSLIDSMATLRGRMEMMTFNHFRQLAGLLNTEQKEKFDQLFWQVLDRAMPPPVPAEPPAPPPPPAVPHGKQSK